MKHYTKHLKNYAGFLLLVLPLVFFATGCSEDDDPVTPPAATEAEMLVAEIEGTAGDYMNTACPAIVKAVDVYADITDPSKNNYLIDIRSATDYANGHAAGSVNVASTAIVAHVKGLSKAMAYDKIVVICYTGQTAAWCTGLLRLSGFTNAYSMKYGMSSWHPDFDKVTPNISSDHVSDFVTTATAKGTAGNLATISTGKTTGSDILADRIAAVQTEGFGAAAITVTDLYLDPTKYYIINYWPADLYTSIGHINGSMQYEPKQDLKLSTFLKTLPTDKTIVVYCFTGQTSGNVAGILRVMGYDAKSLKFGTNAMIWSSMQTAGKTHYVQANDCSNFPTVK